jgi:hypothetical protein
MSEKNSETALATSKSSAFTLKATEGLAKRGLDDLIQWENDDSRRCLAAVSTVDGWGFVDKRGKFVIEPRYAWAASFSENRACFSNSDSAYGWSFLSPRYDHGWSQADYDRFEFLYGQWPFSDKPDNVFGYLNRSGEEVIAPQFSCAEPFSEGLARVALSRRVGFIGIDGELRIDAQFDQAANFRDGLAVVRKNEKCGVVDHMGKSVVSPRFDHIWDFSEGLARFRTGEMSRVGFMDQAGSIVIEPSFDDARDFSEGLAPVFVDDRGWGFITKDGKFAIEPMFSGASSFCGGTAEVWESEGEVWESEGAYRIDRTGARVPDPDSTQRSQSAGAPGFANGLARVENEQRLWGYVDTKGKIVIPFQFFDCRDFVLLDQINKVPGPEVPPGYPRFGI